MRQASSWRPNLGGCVLSDQMSNSPEMQLLCKYKRKLSFTELPWESVSFYYLTQSSHPAYNVDVTVPFYRLGNRGSDR